MLRSREKEAQNSNSVRNRVLETYSNIFSPLNKNKESVKISILPVRTVTFKMHLGLAVHWIFTLALSLNSALRDWLNTIFGKFVGA